MSVKERIRTSILASFVADSLSLGAHWVYDSDEIKQKLGTVKELLKPTLNDYHSGKEAGDLTHYGDQELFLLENLANENKFSASSFFSYWVKAFESYKGYRDGASKTTLQNLQEGKGENSGSDSHDLAGASRFIPLIAVAKTEEELVHVALAQTKLTHNNSEVLGAAEFLARVIFRVVHNNLSPSKAVHEVLDLLAASNSNDYVITRVKVGIESKDKDDEESIRSFGDVKTFGTKTVHLGKACPVNGSLPGVIHFILKYEDNLEEALIANVSVGGDSAARAIPIGAVLGAYKGKDSIPSRWTDALRQRDHINALLDKLQA